MLTWLNRQIRRFPGASEAVAAIEFAVILPLLLTLYLGSQELSALITVDRRVTIIAGTVGDLVARTNACLPSSTLNDYFAAAQSIMGALPTTGLKQLVTEVSVDSTGKATVDWSKPYNGATAKVNGATYTFPSTAMTDISKGGQVIIAETWYPYKPLLGLFFQSTINLYRVNYYVPRYGSSIAIQSSCA